jgi:hypothetical protein
MSLYSSALLCTGNPRLPNTLETPFATEKTLSITRVLAPILNFLVLILVFGVEVLKGTCLVLLFSRPICKPLDENLFDKNG